MNRLRSPLSLLSALLLVLCALLYLIRVNGQFQFLELAAYDLLVATATPVAAMDPPITLVEITEQDIQALGNWPLTDTQLAGTLRALLQADPRVVGADIYRDLSIVPGKQELDELLISDDRIVMIEKFPGLDSPAIAPPPILVETDRIGFSDLVSDAGGVIRRNLLFLANDERVSYSFGLRLALGYLAADGIYAQAGEPDPGNMRLEDVSFLPLEGNEGGYVGADAGGYQILLDYMGGPDPFDHYTLGDLLQGRIPEQKIGQRILILGVAAESVKDRFITPHAILGGTAGDVSGSTLHAHAVRQFLEAAMQGRNPVNTWSDRQESAWIFAWTALGLVFGWFAGSAVRLIPVVLLGAALLFLAVYLGFERGWWIPVVPPLLGLLTASGLATAVLAGRRRRDQQELMGLFARHVSPQVASTIWEHRNEVLEGGRIRPQVLTATVLFTDLQGFTRVSGQMEPEPFLEWLNSYMGAMTDTIMEYGGVLDDYAGDGIKANFGVPLPRTEPAHILEDACHAVHCAQALGKVLNRLNGEWKARGRPGVAMRIGIHTGSVVVGTVGSRLRMKYTTVGNNVNLASRLESIRDVADPNADDDASSCRILISPATADLVGEQFSLANVGRFKLKGILHETGVFCVKMPRDDVKNQEERCEPTAEMRS